MLLYVEIVLQLLRVAGKGGDFGRAIRTEAVNLILSSMSLKGGALFTFTVSLRSSLFPISLSVSAVSARLHEMICK